ncbi:MAG: DUF5686 and carboxypeptidase regulatory-like domain-containing protein [Puia sp.]|nr:DUF5686 and carboxypeptidase regulatory-like domain-containing protein [Puia sp.]
MRRVSFLFFLALSSVLCAGATKLTGLVTDQQGRPLPYASVLVKGGSRGVTSNNEGRYSLDLEPGSYTLSCQYVGYARQEKMITVKASDEALELDFRLSLQELSMAEVVVRPGGEDPAYAIIRYAIKKRKDYENPLDSFTCEAYIKTLIKTRKLPKKVLGQKIEEKDKRQMGVDSAGKGIIFLSESLTRVAFKRPGKLKLEVLSGRESGSNGYGFNFPTFINFYNNNVNIMASRMSPRGFVSPIAESALSYYRYKYLGSFIEDGKEINKIQVIPRRKYEPLFSGTLNIVEGEWRIHSLDLQLVKESQLEILDTLEIRQIHAPIGSLSSGGLFSGSAGAGLARDGKNPAGVWVTKDQVVYFSFNVFGVDAVGNFLNIYNKYDVAPQFRKKFFNNVLIRYDTTVNKKTHDYWDSVRPVPLEPEELSDYRRKDSVFQRIHDSSGARRNRDSLLKEQGKVRPWQFVTGFNRSDFDPTRPLTYSLDPVITGLRYNTVGGLNLHIQGSLSRRFKASGNELSFHPHIRYGFGNGHLNAWGVLALDTRSLVRDGEDFIRSRQRYYFSGGKRVSQFNQEEPITETLNSLYTLLARRNYMKIYENYFAEFRTSRRFDDGLQITAGAKYEDRRPLNNTSDFSVFGGKDPAFTPNYPYEKLDTQFLPHHAFLTGIDLQYQPGMKYIEFPNNKVPIGSRYPSFYFSWQRGWRGPFGSVENFDKWSFSVKDDLNFKLGGLLRYRLGIGGFPDARTVNIQDYQHFNGNQLLFASQYLNSFQLAPYYANSTTASLYATGHIEHHFNGLLTNKIPLFRTLDWWLVGAANGFYVSGHNNYAEVSGGLENIFKLFRVDVVASYLNGKTGQVGVRLGLGGVLGSNFMSRRRGVSGE